MATSNKRNRLEEHDQPSIKKLLLSFNQVVSDRLETVENKLDAVEDLCLSMENKIQSLSSLLVKEGHANICMKAVISNEDPENLSSGTNILLISLNSESDFPNGSWLGDENNPEMRVRCKIPPKDLFHINAHCQSPEKMGLTLLDYLFDRDTQALSNISGCGRHKKQQLNPLFIFGIQCHLNHRFGIDTALWTRIKRNMDSKCRTAFRRKQKGLPLNPSKRSLEEMDEIEETYMTDSNNSSMEDDNAQTLHIYTNGNLTDFSTLNAEIMKLPINTSKDFSKPELEQFRKILEKDSKGIQSCTEIELSGNKILKDSIKSDAIVAD